MSEPQVNRPGSDVAAVEILGGEQGARVLDEYGRYHGLRARIVRTLQGFGYDGTTLAIYDEALRKGDLLLLAALLQRHGVHDMGYFGPGRFQQIRILDTG